jgi:hypothetical protein
MQIPPAANRGVRPVQHRAGQLTGVRVYGQADAEGAEKISRTSRAA